MGGASSTVSVDFFPYKVIVYDFEAIKKFNADSVAALSEESTAATQVFLDESDLHSRLVFVYNEAMREASLPLVECQSVPVIAYKYSVLSAMEQQAFCDAQMAAVNDLESKLSKQRKAGASIGSKDQDYSKSFGGTVDDTKNEREAAAILRGAGDGGGESEDAQLHQMPPEGADEATVAAFYALRKPKIRNNYEGSMLRKAGKWRRFMGAADCYMYFHVLTREVVSIRPQDFDEADLDNSDSLAADIDQELADPANGLPRVDLSDLPAAVEKIISETNKTPLIIDCSLSQPARTFYSYKAMLEDVSSLTIPFGKSGVKREDVMERCRVRLVSALKTGSIFVLYLGPVCIEHADFKKKLCKKDVFPKEVFINAGKKLLGPDYDPKYKAIYREADLEEGQAIVRDGFQCAVISSIDPYKYEELLADCIPLGYMSPIYVNPVS